MLFIGLFEVLNDKLCVKTLEYLSYLVLLFAVAASTARFDKPKCTHAAAPPEAKVL